MDDNVILVVMTMFKYLLIAGGIGAVLGFELARANANMGRLRTALRGGSIGVGFGAFIFGSVAAVAGTF